MFCGKSDLSCHSDGLLPPPHLPHRYFTNCSLHTPVIRLALTWDILLYLSGGGTESVPSPYFQWLVDIPTWDEAQLKCPLKKMQDSLFQCQYARWQHVPDGCIQLGLDFCSRWKHCPVRNVFLSWRYERLLYHLYCFFSVFLSNQSNLKSQVFNSKKTG